MSEHTQPGPDATTGPGTGPGATTGSGWVER
jgi:hypothetical protein